MPTKLALIGSGISHSRSPEIYRKLIDLDIKYDLLDIKNVEDLPTCEYLSENYDGINITAPWKKAYAKFAINEVAHLPGVNCLRFDGNICQATNTDWTAIKVILPQIMKFHNCTNECVVLGDGVMASILLDVCRRMSIQVKQYSRSKGYHLNELQLLNDDKNNHRKLLINACGRDFKFEGTLRGTWVFWDLNYSHSNHEKEIQSETVKYVDGYELLETQAKHAIQFWNRSLSH